MADATDPRYATHQDVTDAAHGLADLLDFLDVVGTYLRANDDDERNDSVVTVLGHASQIAARAKTCADRAAETLLREVLCG